MKFSIITPSFRQFAWLKRCGRSVADQQGVEVEHIVQDGGSRPELEQWAGGCSGVRLFTEPDTGMYDALNKGLAHANGDVIGFLNCDEQYLPGTLARVAEVFEAHPWADIVAGSYLIVDPSQELLAYRKVTPLRRSMILTDHLYAFTCALFFRKAVFAEGLRFDTRFRSIGDSDFVCRALERGHRAVLLPEYLSTFTWTGENLSAQGISRMEEQAVWQELPAWMRMAAPILKVWRRLERWRVGAYASGPIEYSVYRDEDDETRSTIRCERPSFRYPGT